MPNRTEKLAHTLFAHNVSVSLVILSAETGEKVLSEEFHDLCSFGNIIMAVKLRGIRWVGYVARRRKKEMRNTSSGRKNLKERVHFKYVSRRSTKLK